MIQTDELLCPPEWVEIVETAMERALPAPRVAGPDSVRVSMLIRQSKAREDDSHGGPRAQLDAGLHAVQSSANAAWHLCPEHVFADIGVSGWAPNIKRPGFDGMMSAVRAGRLDVVVVYALSRLSRKGALDVLNIIDEFRKHGVRLVSITEPWLDTDPSNPIGQAILGLTAALAQQESTQKSAFITDANAQARMRGGHISGRPTWGMTAERKMVDGVVVNRLVPSPETSPHALRLIELAEDKKGRHEIAETLTAEKILTPTGKEVWLASTVWTLLRDPRWAGYSVDAFTRVETDESGNQVRRPISSEQAILYGADGNPIELHEGLITRERWWRLQGILGIETAKARVRNHRKLSGPPIGLFARLGILRCAVCGRPMQFNPGAKGGRYPFYVCNKQAGGPKNAGRHSMGVTVSQVDEIIALLAFRRLAALDLTSERDGTILREIAMRFASQQAGGETRQQKAAVESELGHVQGALENLTRDREAGLYSGPTMGAEYASSVRRLAEAECRLNESIAELAEREKSRVQIPPEWFVSGGDLLGEDSPWSAWGIEDRRLFLFSMLKSVEVKPVGRKGNHVPVIERLVLGWVDVQ